ncbi:uncharacterized protein ACWYII_009789 isoform 1-T1 [Salvelinus alpinus]
MTRLTELSTKLFSKQMGSAVRRWAWVFLHCLIRTDLHHSKAKHYEGTTDLDRRCNIQRNSQFRGYLGGSQQSSTVGAVGRSTPLISVKPNRQRPSTDRAQEVSLEELGILLNTQTWIHMMSFTTNHPPTFHYIIYSYCCCHYLLMKFFYYTGHIICEIHRLTKNTSTANTQNKESSSAWTSQSPSSSPPSETGYK